MYMEGAIEHPPPNPYFLCLDFKYFLRLEIFWSIEFVYYFEFSFLRSFFGEKKPNKKIYQGKILFQMLS